MQMQRHDAATCPRCGSGLWFGLKSEGTGWSVYYDCDECGFEEHVGRVTMAEISDRDEAHDRAASMGEQF